MVKIIVQTAVIAGIIFTLSLAINERLKGIEETLKTLEVKREYQVDAKYVFVNPCDLWDVKLKDKMEVFK